MKVGIMGPQGSGKGTQSKLICAEYGLPYLSTGDMVRTISSVDTDLGREVRTYSEARTLVPDDIMNKIVKEFVSGQEEFLIDGYPRTLDQAKFLDGIMDLDGMLYLNLPLDECRKRMGFREFCKPCGITYGLDKVPLKPETCDSCYTPLSRRKDDNPEAIETGLKSYLANTVPVLTYYANQGILIELPVGPRDTPQEIFRLIERNLYFL